MKNRMTRISMIMLAVGLILSSKTHGLSTIDWTVLASFSILGFCVGAVQAQAIAKARRGIMNKWTRTVVVIISFTVLLGLKVLIAISGMSHLPNTGTSLLIQICFSIFGLFLGRGLVLGYHSQNAKNAF